MRFLPLAIQRALIEKRYNEEGAGGARGGGDIMG